MPTVSDALRALRHLLTHADLEGPVEDKPGFEVVRVVFTRGDVSHAQQFRDALDDVIDGGRTGGKETSERD